MSIWALKLSVGSRNLPRNLITGFVEWFTNSIDETRLGSFGEL